MTTPMDNPTQLMCLVDALNASERARQRELTVGLAVAVRAARETAEGWGFDLGSDAATFQMAAEWIGIERRCCPFLTFTLEWSGETSMTLQLTGPGEARSFIGETFAALSRTRLNPSEPG